MITNIENLNIQQKIEKIKPENSTNKNLETARNNTKLFVEKKGIEDEKMLIGLEEVKLKIVNNNNLNNGINKYLAENLQAA